MGHQKRGPGQKIVAAHRFADGGRTRHANNELAGNRETQRSGAACLVDRRPDAFAGVAGGATGRVAAS